EAATASYVAPRNDIEKQLAEIWQELLGVEKVGIHDNFFELGGDSIITIQVVSRLRRLGYYLQPRYLFEYQTISSLSNITLDNLVLGEQGILNGVSDLLPIQQKYFDTIHYREPNYNQSLLLSIDQSVELSFLDQAIKGLINHHDVLRFTYKREEDHWIQFYGDNKGSIEVINLEDTIFTELSDAIKDIYHNIQNNLSIEKGEVFKVILLKTTKEKDKNCLFIVAHHLVIDGVSWRILLDDLERIMTFLKEGKNIELGLKGSSYRQWGLTMKKYATDKAFHSQYLYWLSVISNHVTLPVDKTPTDNKRNDIRNSNSSNSSILTKELTSLLLKEVNNAYGTNINDILLSCLALTINNWSGHNKVIIGLEGHGREQLSIDIDVSNTVGWFTSLYPVLLSTKKNSSLGEIIKSIKEELRLVPDKGIGYGALRYLHPDKEVKKAFSGVHWDIVFNYLGQLDNALESNSWLTGFEGFSEDQNNNNRYLENKLEINGSITGGELILDWNYSTSKYNPKTINKLSNQYLDNLEKIILHCCSKQKRDFTPSDYGLEKEVGFQELEKYTSFLIDKISEGDDILEF
ncbi:condensation domain-containing protein, partial [Aquimarina addita]|uniref:condensation domain-containing protein n=1 Tax=Aquimarina addita TaxID=870485 RepID=UPI0031F0B78F